MPHVIEPAPTGRAKCRGCGEKIGAGELRFGESLPNPFAEGESFQWSHLECGAMKRPESFLEALAAQGEPPPDAQRLEALARQGVEHPRAARVSGAERDPSGRAACRHCRQKIEKGALRLALVFFEDGRFTPAGSLHVACAGGYCGTIDLMPRIKRFAPGLGEAELREVEAELQKPSPPAAPAPTTPSEAGSE